MPLGGALTLGLVAAPGVYQVFKGLRQNKEANNLKLQDTTPAAFREELAMSRQAANSRRAPGEGTAVDRINQGYSNSLNNAVQAGTSSANILSALGGLDRNRNSAVMGLADRAAAFQQQQQGRLSGNLRQQAQYQMNDLNTLNRDKAALKEASSRNIFGGVSTIAGAGVMGATGGFKAMAGQNQRLAAGGAPMQIDVNQPVPFDNGKYGYQDPNTPFVPDSSMPRHLANYLYNPNQPFSNYRK